MNTSSLCPDCGIIFSETGEGPGGKFNGPSIKTVLKNLKPLEDILPTDAFPFIEYLQSLKEVHEMCISEDFDPNYDILLSEFKCKFDVLYEKFQLPMTLKIHVIVDHYGDFFKETGKNLGWLMVNIMKLYIIL